jgi:hypothetical protein
MKKSIFILGLVLTTVSLWAQASCEEVKKENEYLKKALNINSPIKNTTAANIDFNLLKCEGDIKQQTVTVVLTLINHDATKEFQFSRANAIDVEANQWQTYSIAIGNADKRNKIYTDTPVKTVIQFSKILPSVKMLKHIGVEYYSETPGKVLEIEFKDIPISWK